MKILLTLLILGFSTSFIYQQLQLRSLESKLQLLDNKKNQAVTLASTKKVPQIFDSEKSSPEPSVEVDNKYYKPPIEKIEKNIIALENQIIDLRESHLEFENKLISLNQETSLIASEATQSYSDRQRSIAEEKEQARNEALEKQLIIEEKLSYEEVKTDWALPMESKITDSFAANSAFSSANVVQAQCKSTLCEVSIFYNPTSDEDLFEFENEIVASLGENLTNIHQYTKSGTMEEGYSFTLIASP